MIRQCVVARGRQDGRRLPSLLSSLTILLLLVSCRAARASETSAAHTDQRAGYPKRVAWYAASSPNGKYQVGYVGGGTAFKGEPRYPSEGVWGMDYRGKIPRKVFLRWSHGRRYQGGTGSYNPDQGPVVPVPGILRKF